MLGQYKFFPTLIRRDKIVKGNIQDILDFHKNVLGPGVSGNLQKPEQIKETFCRGSDHLKLIYGEYGTKVNMKMHVIKTHEAYFRKLEKRAGMKTTFLSQISSPMTHLMQYHLFFEALAKLYGKQIHTSWVRTPTNSTTRQIHITISEQQQNILYTYFYELSKINIKYNFKYEYL